MSSAPPPVLTELKLSEQMREAVDSGFGTGKPLAVSYVDEKGAPHLSYRGSTQAYSDTQLAIWVRNPQGGILDAIAKNPAVALIYGNFDPNNRGFMIFHGRAHVDGSEQARKHVYEHAHEFERGRDKDRKGVAVIIDLDSVEGFFGGAQLKMRR
jgi:Pyridoxamine 5'-phosphate oxidase